MKKVAAVAISIGVILVIAGLVMVGIFGGEAIRNTDWKSIFSGTRHNLEQANDGKDFKQSDLDGLTKIDIQVDTYSVYVMYNHDVDVSVKYVSPLEDNVKLDVEFVDGTLSVVETDTIGTVFFGNIFKSNRFIVIYVPQTELLTSAFLKINAKTASIKIQDVNFESIHCIAKTGSINLSNVKSNDAALNAGTGSVNVTGIDCDSLNITTDTGSVNLNGTTVKSYVNVKVKTGSVNCHVNTNKLVVEADTGSVNFTTDALFINITTDTGSVNGTVLGNKSDCNIQVYKGTGKSNLQNQTVSGAERYLTVDVDTGSININFRNN